MNIASFSEHCNGLFDAAIRDYHRLFNGIWRTLSGIRP